MEVVAFPIEHCVGGNLTFNRTIVELKRQYTGQRAGEVAFNRTIVELTDLMAMSERLDF